MEKPPSTDSKAKDAAPVKTPAPKESSAKKPLLSRSVITTLVSLVIGITIGALGLYFFGGTKENQSSSTEAMTATTTYPDIEACDILREKDVEAVLGQPVVNSNASIVDEDPNSPPTPTMCVYLNDNLPKPQDGTLPTGDFIATQTILTLLHFNGDLAKTQTEIDAYQAAVAGSTEAPVDGLGDAAYWNAGQTTLTVRKGDTIFSLKLGDPVVENRTLDRTKTLAEKVLLRY